MGNSEHIELLGKGAQRWNAWRREYESIAPLLDGADLRARRLRGYDLSGVNLSCADLRDANFRRADLSGAKLDGARLHRAFLSGTRIGAANFRHAVLYETLFANVDLSEALHLDTCLHKGPSVIDHRTLARSKRLPIEFLQGCGLPDAVIAEVASTERGSASYCSCFISYSSGDEGFAKKLFGDLQKNGVRCWFAPHSVRIGDKFSDAIEDGIQESERVLLVLSEHSLSSRWVETEVATTLEEETRRGTLLLFPIRIDDSVMTTTASWARNVRRLRYIGDFTRWRELREYAAALERLLDDLNRIPGRAHNKAMQPDRPSAGR